MPLPGLLTRPFDGLKLGIRSSDVTLRRIASLDPGFIPAALWNRAYGRLAGDHPASRLLGIAIGQTDGTCSVFKTRVLPQVDENIELNRRYVERIVKFLLWQRGGYRITVGGEPGIAEMLRQIYCPEGDRRFDCEFLGQRLSGRAMVIEECAFDELPESRERSRRLGGNLDGCRIGFDLGGSFRKAVALRDGQVVFSESIAWDPYFQKDPQFHFSSIDDSIRRAAASLPRVDAIGGSTAGAVANNEVRASSLFRGISEVDFEKRIRRIFLDLRKTWNDVPFEVANDGEVAALSGANSLRIHSVLGISMGTSLAAGYVDADGRFTSWLNELAFAPVDYQDDGARDEWSGDLGLGVQHFSQQALGRLVPRSGISLEREMPFAEQLKTVQALMENGDSRARGIYETIGVWLGYSVAHYAEFYPLCNVLCLGGMMMGEGGDVIIQEAAAVLKNEFPDLARRVQLWTCSGQDRSHGQAIAAATLPELCGGRRAS
ncbi:MAG TPA: ROK family protein [Chthoniobacteraceae bacterium]|jgi:predicted NBD/HSP70 family sugar kinase|nr:ROK family protein [Chthoniobacteraceae bacterium]